MLHFKEQKKHYKYVNYLSEVYIFANFIYSITYADNLNFKTKKRSLTPY